MIGLFSLNISFLLHLILYLPQVLHNRSTSHIKYLSVNMHLILFFCYFLDIFYGFASNMQWQYRTVSIVGFSLLIVQYTQIIQYLITKGNKHTSRVHILILATTLFCVYHFFANLKGNISTSEALIAGYISKILFIISTIPQIIKNWQVKNKSAISIYFILLSITIACLDTITAWTLNWGWPNKLTSPIMIFMLALMLPIPLAKEKSSKFCALN